MASYTQHEELEQLKEWWKEYGSSLVIGVSLGVAILVGYRYWIDYRETQRATASLMYEQLLDGLRTKRPEARATGEKLIDEYASTPYAAMAALLLARQAHETSDKALARERLEWALKNAKDDATEHVARLRLARLQLDAGEVQAVAALIKVKDIAGFDAEYHELHGDVAAAQGQKDAARNAYREALKQLTAGSPYASVISMKLDDLGSEQRQ